MSFLDLEPKPVDPADREDPWDRAVLDVLLGKPPVSEPVVSAPASAAGARAFNWLDALDGEGELPPSPPHAPAFSWAAYLQVWKSVLRHAQGNDRQAAEEISPTALLEAGGLLPGPLFVVGMLRVAYLVAAGEERAASIAWPFVRVAGERLPPPGESLRARWTEARVQALGSGRAEVSERLAAIQAEFAELEMALETVCAWADRAALDLAEGRPAAPWKRRGEIEWARAAPSLSPRGTAALDTVLSLLKRRKASPRLLRRLVAYLLGRQLHDSGPFEALA